MNDIIPTIAGSAATADALFETAGGVVLDTAENRVLYPNGDEQGE